MKKIFLFLFIYSSLYCTTVRGQTIQIANNLFEPSYSVDEKTKVDIFVQVYDKDNTLCFPKQNEPYILRFGKALQFDTEGENAPCSTIGTILTMNTRTSDYYQGGAIIPFCSDPYSSYVSQIMIGPSDGGAEPILDKQGNLLVPGNLEVKQLWLSDILCPSKIKYISQRDKDFYLMLKHL